MGRLLLASLLAACSLAAQAAGPWPYDEHADAPALVTQALAAARKDHKPVLLVFGANWCPDCRALDKAMHGSSEPLIRGRFHVVKVNVGNFDTNLELSHQYGDPIRKGIPAIVVVDARGGIVYSTKGGDLANAGQMGDQGIYDFLAQKVAPGHR